MGEFVKGQSFSAEQYAQFKENLRRETHFLCKWIKDQPKSAVSKADGTALTIGMELETWLVDENCLPAPKNRQFLDLLGDTMVVPELSRFNAELNTPPLQMSHDSLAELRNNLETTWRNAQTCAQSMGLSKMMIGSLPTLRDAMLGMEFMSDCERYYALNKSILDQRRNQPIKLEINGREDLTVEHGDIMLEAGCTSLQVHLRPSHHQLKEYYNASLVASSAIAAACANTPYFLGSDLWDESRIPVFEQSLAMPGFQDPHGNICRRVTFGTGYVREDFAELFLENLNAFPALLPSLYNDDVSKVRHLRLHNGVIWRWNRPIVGFDDNGAMHLRIEHRVPAAGPTPSDIVGNVGFYLGLVNGLVQQYGDVQSLLPFNHCRQNFYEGAKRGMTAEVRWLDGRDWDLQTLLDQELIPLARNGLMQWGVNSEDINHYLGEVLASRVRTGRTGAAWQRAFIATHGSDFQSLTKEYLRLQEEGRPVHEWTV